MKSDNSEIKDVLGRFESGQMSRRGFMRSMALLGVSTAVANAVMQSPLGATRAFAAISGPEERAWALAKEPRPRRRRRR